MRGRDLAQRVAQKLDLQPRAGIQRPGPASRRRWRSRHRADQVLRDVAVPSRSPRRRPTPPAPPTSYAGDPGPQLSGRAAGAAQRRAGSRQPAGGHARSTSSDPEFAARAANAFADEYVAQNLSLKVADLEKSAEWLTGEVERQAQAGAGERDASSRSTARSRTPARSTAARTSSSRGSTRSNEQLTKARTDRIQKEGLWRQIQERRARTSNRSASVLNNANVQNLRSAAQRAAAGERRASAERYGEKHPDYQKRGDGAGQRQNAAAGRDHEGACRTPRTSTTAAVARRSACCSGQLNEAKRRPPTLGRKGVDYAVLVREAESNRTIYNQLLTREKELRVVANSRTNNVRRGRSRARSRRAPFTPNHRRDWVYAMALGLALGLGIAFGIDYLDDTVKTPDDITRRLKLQVPRPGADRRRRAASADLGAGAARLRRGLSLDSHRAGGAAAGHRRPRRGGGQLAAARRQDHDRGQHRDGAGRRRRARAADRRRHAAAERAQGAAHDQRSRPVAAAGRPGAHARSGAAHARSEPADDHRRPHAGQSVGAAGVGSHARAAVGSRNRAVRLDHHRHAAGARGDRRGDPRAAGAAR